MKSEKMFILKHKGVIHTIKILHKKVLHNKI